MSEPRGVLLKASLAIASALAGLIALGLGMLYMNVRAKELPVESARDFIQLEEGDVVLHAFTGTRWLDSQRYFVVKADSEGFDDRIKRLSEPGPNTPGVPSNPVVRVVAGPGKDLWPRSEPVPSWWDVEALESAVAVDISSKRGNHSGSLSIFSKDRGLIYVLDR
ncbi:MAG: hypothetical protein WC943_01675 [Elusimicrobiota bacterium]|jgi:hypothetical protein